MITCDYGEIEKRVMASDDLPEEPDYYTEWSQEFGVDRRVVKHVAMPYMYDGVNRTMKQIKELVRKDLVFQGHIKFTGGDACKSKNQ